MPYFWLNRWAVVVFVILSALGAATFTWWSITLPERQQAMAQAQEQARQNLLFQAAEQAVRALLRDPSSAQFKRLSILKGKDGKSYVCGQVNAKNAFGGYTGFSAFAFRVANGPAYLVEEEPLQVIDACY